MRISDWSSDVCSSDLPIERRVATVEGAGESDGVNTAAAAATPISRHPDLFRRPTRSERRRVRADAGASPARRNEKGSRSRRSEEQTSELQPLMRNSYAVFFLTQQQNNPQSYLVT